MICSLLSSLRSARGQIEREVLAPGWMEGRSGTVVVLATGIDPSPLVLPPLYPPLLSYPLLLYPRFTPFFPSPFHFSAPSPPSFTNALEHTYTTQIIRTHIYEYRSFLSLVLVATPRLLVLFSPSSLDSRSFLIFHSLILNIQIQRISRTPSIIPSCSSLFMLFYMQYLCCTRCICIFILFLIVSEEFLLFYLEKSFFELYSFFLI